MPKPPLFRHLVIEGNIGSGKTTLTKMLAETWNARTMLEAFEQNPFLPKFYEEPDRYAFPLELSFLAERFHQKKTELSQTDLFQPGLISDYLFDKSLIFAKINLPEDEYNLYSSLFSIIHERLPRPNLTVFLHSAPERALSNIALRGRSYEQTIQLDYLKKINDGYLNHFLHIDPKEVLSINTTDLDFVNQERDYLLIQSMIRSHIVQNINQAT
ncbi:MAG: deoxyguanosine kinase [Granulosicoccus sp.]|jgi:deoxyguanosine kinase